MQSVFALAALAPLAYAFTQPTEATFGSLLTPDLSSPVTQGETYKVTWDATGHETSTVSLVLCRGDSTNCVNDKTAIVEGVSAASQSYEWDVPCSLPEGVQKTSTGYGMLIIEDGTGIFQYSTQFSVEANPKCGNSESSTTESGPSKTGSTIIEPTTGPSHNGTSWGSKNSTSSESTMKPTTMPTLITSTAAVTASESATATWSTATQPAATPAEQTAVSGARKNAAGALFLGAVAAAFML